MATSLIPFKYDFLDPTYALLGPALIQRVLSYAQQHSPELDPVDFTRKMMARLMSADPDVYLWAVTTPEGEIQGHALGVLNHQQVPWLFLWQFGVDVKGMNVGDQLLDMIRQWAIPQGIEHLQMVIPPTSVKALSKAYNLQPYKMIMSLKLGEEAEDADDH